MNFTKTSGTHNGVTYTWSTDGTCTVTGGTTTNPSVNNLYYNPTALPNGIEVNHTYYIKYKTTDENVRLSLQFINQIHQLRIITIPPTIL